MHLTVLTDHTLWIPHKARASLNFPYHGHHGQYKSCVKRRERERGLMIYQKENEGRPGVQE